MLEDNNFDPKGLTPEQMDLKIKELKLKES
jgi:hypothetical protein